MLKRKMFPILKWAGGKTQILERIIENMPKQYNNYYEPFIGGASVLLGVSPQKAFINDVNEQLINLYTQLQKSAESVIETVNKLDAVPCDKDFYYKIREKYNEKLINRYFDVECVAFLIWLNKHCFNGLYRVNRKGLFNVPFNGRTHGKSISEDNIKLIAEYLKNSNITITCLDFEKACADIQQGDFVYFDSPYVPESVTAKFTNYTINGFSIKDHERLSYLFRRLDCIGAKIMLSNNDVPLVRELYAGYKIQAFDVKRMINRNADKRAGREVIVTNY